MTTLCKWTFVVAAVVCGCGEDGFTAATPAAAGPTWYRDVEPIVQAKCGQCHYEGGIGPMSFDAGTARSLASLMASEVEARTMPPWPPGPASQPIVGARVLSDEQIATIHAWSDAGAPLGDPKDHADRPPEITFDPGRAPDVVAKMSPGDAFVPPGGTDALDEVRCFVLDLPGDLPSSWITALNWVPGQPAATHHIGGMAIDADSAALAKSFYGKDGRPGYECAGGFGDGIAGLAGLSASAAGSDTGTLMPKGTGIFLPAGSSLLITIHYVLKNVVGDDGASGVELWLAPDDEKKQLRPMVQRTFHGPSELPCPSGPSDDPSDPCSREYAIAHVASTTPAKARATNDFLMAACDKTLDEHYAQMDLPAQDPSRLLVPSTCGGVMHGDEVIHVLHSHMHTRGWSANIEVEQPDGSWLTLLDIPKWEWTWEAAYLLEQGVRVSDGTRVRWSCVFDNGTDNQWSLATGEPGHGGRATPPLEPPRYVIATSERSGEMCGALLTVERLAWKGGSYEDACHEAQARYEDVCGATGLDFTAAPCEGKLEQSAVLLIQASPAVFNAFACAPQGPAVGDGATCGDIATCALTCSATQGWSGQVSAPCIQACESNANAYPPKSPATPGSELGKFHLDALLECAQPTCGGAASWEDYLACMKVKCIDVVKFCWAS